MLYTATAHQNCLLIKPPQAAYRSRTPKLLHPSRSPVHRLFYNSTKRQSTHQTSHHSNTNNTSGSSSCWPHAPSNLSCSTVPSRCWVWGHSQIGCVSAQRALPASSTSCLSAQHGHASAHHKLHVSTAAYWPVTPGMTPLLTDARMAKPRAWPCSTAQHSKGDQRV